MDKKVLKQINSQLAASACKFTTRLYLMILKIKFNKFDYRTRN